MPKIRKEAVDTQIGERLRQLRLARGLSQADLGRALAISYQQIQKYEKGSNRMSASTLLKVAKYFGLSPQSFFEGLALPGHAAMPGFHEENEGFAQPAPTSEGADLLKAFMRIADPAARKRLLEFARSLSDEEK